MKPLLFIFCLRYSEFNPPEMHLGGGAEGCGMRGTFTCRRQKLSASFCRIDRVFIQKAVNRLSLLYSRRCNQTGRKALPEVSHYGCKPQNWETLWGAWRELPQDPQPFKDSWPGARWWDARPGHCAAESAPPQSAVRAAAWPSPQLVSHRRQHLSASPLTSQAAAATLPGQKAADPGLQAAASWSPTFVLLCLPRQPCHARQESCSSGH